MIKQGVNLYLPSWGYIPDAEPYVFDGRVYIYGSHDRFNGHAYCLNDYVCWSAPVDDLGDWQYKGVIYKRTDDPLNPDVRYYLYYILDKVAEVSVAGSDTPAGEYEFYGYVHDLDGVRLGNRKGDGPQPDLGVLTEGDKTYLLTNFCAKGDTSRSGAMAPDVVENLSRNPSNSDPNGLEMGDKDKMFVQIEFIDNNEDQNDLQGASLQVKWTFITGQTAVEKDEYLKLEGRSFFLPILYISLST